MQYKYVFEVEYPDVDEEIGLTLNYSGRYVVVADYSAQSADYGIRYQDIILKVNNRSCTELDPSDVVSEIRKHLKKKLTITFQRSYKPDEMVSIKEKAEKPLQNDSIYYDGMFLLRCGISSTKPFSEKVVRIVRMTGPLLQYAPRFNLIPMGIALVWYNISSSGIPYEAVPIGAQNLLPCLIDIRPGTNGFYVLHFSCRQDILLTTKNREQILDFIETLSHVYKRDIKHLIKAISGNTGSIAAPATQAPEEDDSQILDFGEEENQMTKRNLHSTLNIPYPNNIVRYVKELYDGKFISALNGIYYNLQSLIATGFHPEQINHSIIALFINCKQHFSDSEWDEKTRRYVQRIIVEIAKHNADYIRTTSAHPAGFYIFGCGDKEIEGEYRVTRDKFNDIPVFVSSNECRLFRQIYQGHSTWILQKKNSTNATYYIHSTDIIPPRFNWVCPVAENYPAPIVQAITYEV